MLISAPRFRFRLHTRQTQTKQTRKHLLLPKYFCINSIWNNFRLPFVTTKSQRFPKNRKHDDCHCGRHLSETENWFDICLQQIYFSLKIIVPSVDVAKLNTNASCNLHNAVHWFGVVWKVSFEWKWKLNTKNIENVD